jgi:tetratricopeptide (TPR) repeat protein
LAAALLELAQTKQGADAEELLIEAMRKCEDALKLLPNDHKALGNWGNALMCLAKMKQGEDAEKLFDKSFQKYEAVLKIKPDDSTALDNWGTALAYLARMKEGTEREALLKEALQKCQAAEDISKGKGSYNRACVRALCGDTDRALSQLEAALQAESEPPRGHILDDPDLESIRSTGKFKELLDKYRPE